MTPFKYTNIALVILLAGFDILYLAGITDWWWLLVVLIVYIHILVLGAIFIGWNFYLRSYHGAGSDSKLIALSFDDGPASQTDAILNILKQQNVPAIFFIIGKNGAENTAALKKIDEEGHVLGNHSYGHGFNFDWQSSRKMSEEITRTNDLICSATGKRPQLFRPPYGVTNPNLAKAVRNTGMYSIGWRLRSFDTAAKDGPALLQRCLTQLKGGDIILFHDSVNLTTQILTEFVTEARKKGFIFERADKLLDIEAYA